MTRLTIMLALCLGAALPVEAQIFPKTDKDRVAEDVEKAKRGGDAPKPEDPPKQPEDPKPNPKTVDGQAALARFKELRESLRKAEKDELKESRKMLDQFQPLMSQYFEALTELKLGYYKEASRLFKKIDKPGDDDVKKLSGDAHEIGKGLQNGRQYFYRMVAEVMALYSYSDNDADFDKKWTRAEKAGQSVINELERAVAARQIEQLGGGIQQRKMENWLSNEKAEWIKLRNAEKALNDSPGELGSWQKYISACSGRERDELTPNYLDARAAILMLREIWVDDSVVKRGFVDVGLAWSYAGVLQFEKALAALEPGPAHGDEGRRNLEEQKREIQRIQGSILRDFKK